MSVASEITRIQNAKGSLKTSINAKTDAQHQITNETIDNYAEFVDSITTGGGGLDWSALGFNETPQSIQNGYNYAKYIKDNNITTSLSNDLKLRFLPSLTYNGLSSMENWYSNCSNLQSIADLTFPNITDVNGTFWNCSSLEDVKSINGDGFTDTRSIFRGCSILKNAPIINTSKVTRMDTMFQNCTNLEYVPQYNTSKAQRLSNIFSGCQSLTDESLNNILKMCININPSYSRAKTLAELGFTSSYYSTSRIQALTEYQNFTNAGWSIGY